MHPKVKDPVGGLGAGHAAHVVGLPGIRGSVDGFGQHRVPTTGARAAGGGGVGGGRGSNRATVVPSV